MATNDRMTNERYHEWMEYFEKIEENKRREQEREFLSHVLENGTVIDRCLSDYDLRLDCVRSNASEEVIVQHEDTIYYLHVENEVCDDRIIVCEDKKSVSEEESKNTDTFDEDKCGACGCTPCDCGWGS